MFRKGTESMSSWLLQRGYCCAEFFIWRWISRHAAPSASLELSQDGFGAGSAGSKFFRHSLESIRKGVVYVFAPAPSPGSGIIGSWPPARQTRASRMLLEIALRIGDAFSQSDFRFPSQLRQLAAIHELAWRAIRLVAIKFDPAVVADHAADDFRHPTDCDVFTRAYIEVGQHGGCVCLISRAFQMHHVQAGFGHVVHMQEFAARRAAAPDRHAGRAGHLCFMKASDQRRNHMAVFRMVIVARPVQIGRHYAAVIGAVLPV